MIVSTATEKSRIDFESLLSRIKEELDRVAQNDETYFLSRSGVKLEKDVFKIASQLSEKTPFEGSFELVSGQRFPDIVAYVNLTDGFGIEVKTSIQNHWKTVGSSLFESTRIGHVNHVYLLFGKLVNPIEFKIKKYEECLYDVAVTHSPRYLIDMETAPENTIFSKLRIKYDELRVLDNPFKPIKAYYRETKLPRGEDLWWIEKDNEISGVIRLWSNLSLDKKKNIKVEAFCVFPELFGNSSRKYWQLSSWLIAKHKIVSHALRDQFTAKGQVPLSINGRTYPKIPRIFGYLKEYKGEIKKRIFFIDEDELRHYWNYRGKIHNKYDVWKQLVSQNAKTVLKETGFDILDMLD